MRLSKNFLPTLKEVPSDALIPSHQLMLRAGMIRPLGAGVYSFLPLGYRLVKKVMEIIRDEMDAIGGQEFHLPALNPLELWEETGRAKAFGDTMFHVKNRPLVLAPTHEEVICFIAKNHIKSYRDLPQIWYQIQTKFRNEPRPRSGVIRGRQFLMKDSYSLDATWDGLDTSYDLHAEAYKKIFTRAGLKFFIVGASSGAMGGSASQEFMIESEAGEDTCAVCDQCGYAANLEVAASHVTNALREGESKPIEEIHTPNVKTIDELKTFLHIEERFLAKSLVYMKEKTPVLILMMGNDQLNESKLLGILGNEARPLQPDELKALTGADGGSIGPIGLNGFTIIADKRLEGANNLISGANKNDYHLKNIDLQRDVNIQGYHDMRTVQPGEPCPTCNQPLRVVNAIELGHIFKLGTKYADALHAYYLDENGKERPIIMGSYGIGVERIIACHIEQSHDKNGIVWSKSLSPFHVHLVLVNSNNEKIVSVAESLYEKFQESLIDVLYDDRSDVSPGFKFKDADLLGMPLQVIVGEKNVSNGKIEIKDRATGKRDILEIGKVVNYVEKWLES
ncbi:MAG: proline--tRNA ligase [Ignavibacteria bacterium]|nr:proline--tRNA ligase [Ignavibacteria bacterium]MBI3765431.1 proline--tRNA ligase [Ignavibacteriales bacterium]